MLRRLPISLRFDDDDSDFYYGFIEQKKNDRELSSLILDLLHVYYENEEVRNIVNEYVIQKSPYMHIHEQLERIALEHSRQSVSTNMLNDYTDNARKKVSEPSEPVKEEKPVEKEPLMLNEGDMEKVIEQKVAEALGRMMMSGMSLPVQEVAKSVSDNVGKTIKEEVTPIVSVPKVDNPPFVEMSMEDEIPVSIPKSVPKTVPTVAKAVPTSSNAPKIAGESSESMEDRPKKPASFGKLLGSMK